MALFVQHKEDSLQWGIWKMDESLDELLALLPDRNAYEQAMQRFTAVHRKREWLSVRVLLYLLLGEAKEIDYEPSGKPYLKDRSSFISISHTKGYVAVILSPVAEVGIDVEQYGQRIHKVAHKFMRPDEEAGVYENESTWALLLHWSAKEVLFKCVNVAEVDFREHLRIIPFSIEKRGVFNAQEYRTELRRNFLIHYQLFPDFVLTWQIDVLSHTLSKG